MSNQRTRRRSNVEVTGSSSRDNWLSDAERETWLAFLTGSSQVISALDRQLQRDAGIPHSWYGLLAVLSEQPDRRIRQGDLAGFAGFSLSRLSHAIGKLEERGWLAREVDPADRRAWDVVLTDEGLEALTEMAPGHVRTVREVFFSALTDAQVRQLSVAFTAIRENLALAGIEQATG